MISDEVQELLYKAIQIFDALAEKDYLVFGQISLRHSTEVFQIRIKKEYFWHLLGCKVRKNVDNLYSRCLNKEKIVDCLDYTKGSSESMCREKYYAFIKVFDFVNYAKEIRICDTKDTPDKFNFVLAIGHFSGIIGYDSRQPSNIYFPKSTQSKPIKKYNSKSTARKIIAIIAKDCSESNYDCIRYEIKKNILKDIINDIDLEYKKLIDKAILDG